MNAADEAKILATSHAHAHLQHLLALTLSNMLHTRACNILLPIMDKDHKGTS